MDIPKIQEVSITRLRVLKVGEVNQVLESKLVSLELLESGGFLEKTIADLGVGVVVQHPFTCTKIQKCMVKYRF
jgi:hypothetical protein